MPKDNDRTLVFIYGTLRRACRAHSRMVDSEWVGEARMKGKLVYVNRYPGFVDGDGEVKGELYIVSDNTLKSLDEYEGCFCDPPDYRREKRRCRTVDGAQLEAYVYVFQLKGSEEYQIPDGDWMKLMDLHPELNGFS